MPRENCGFTNRSLAWLAGFGYVFVFSSAVIASALVLWGNNHPLSLSAFCGGVVALRWAGLHSDRDRWWLIAGIPGFLFFIGSSVAVLQRIG